MVQIEDSKLIGVMSFAICFVALSSVEEGMGVDKTGVVFGKTPFVGEIMRNENRQPMSI